MPGRVDHHHLDLDERFFWEPHPVWGRMYFIYTLGEIQDADCELNLPRDYSDDTKLWLKHWEMIIFTVRNGIFSMSIMELQDFARLTSDVPT